MMSKELFNNYNTIESNILMNFKLIDIRLGKIEYTNDDINELIKHYIEKEEYILVDKLHKLKQNKDE